MVNTVQHRRSFCSKLQLGGLLRINDEIEICIKYFVAAIEFVDHLIKCSPKMNQPMVPFQIDFVIGYPEPVEEAFNISNVLFDQEQEDDDDDGDDPSDDDEKDNSNDNDIIGDIKLKLENNKLEYVQTQNGANDLVKSRAFVDLFESFKKKLQDESKSAESKPRTGDNFDYPYHKRFVTFIDRRKKNENKNDKNDIFMFNPPNDCRDIPHDYIPEIFISTSTTCLIPNMNYYQTKKVRYMDETNLNLTANSSRSNGQILTLSVKCYLYFNGSIWRFYPQDIKTVLATLFVSNQVNKSFMKNEELINQYIERMDKIVKDKYFEGFCQKIHAP